MVAPSCCLEYQPTPHFWAILLFVIFPLIGFSYKVMSTFLYVTYRVLRSIFLFLYCEEWERTGVETNGVPSRKRKPKGQNGGTTSLNGGSTNGTSNITILS